MVEGTVGANSLAGPLGAQYTNVPESDSTVSQQQYPVASSVVQVLSDRRHGYTEMRCVSSTRPSHRPGGGPLSDTDVGVPF